MVEKKLVGRRRGGRGRTPWPALRLVVADGFADFTRTQHEILDILAWRAEEIFISLPLEADRTELFDKPLRTLAEFRRRHPTLTHEELPRPAPLWPAMAHLERTLFGNPRHARPAADAAGLEIIAAASPLDEIQWIASRIKRLLVEGDPAADGRRVRPGEVAVVFRHSPEAGGLAAEVFDAFGIPAAMELGQPLNRCPAIVALAALLRLEADDWPLGSLLAVLGSNYFSPRLARVAKRRIPRAKRAGDSPAANTPRPPRVARSAGPRGSSAPIAAALLRRLAAALDELPERASLAEWGDAWRRLARQTGLLAAANSPPLGVLPIGACDREAWDVLQRSLRESDLLAQWLGREAPTLDRRAALAALLDVAASRRLNPDGGDGGRVRVLSAANARALRMPYVFLAGLSEKSFPSPEREDRLYGHAEAQRLVDRGLPLVTRSQRSSEEMLMFYEAATRASRRLWLTYPAMDESAQPLSPSPYLKEVEQACGERRIARIVRNDLNPVPADDGPLSPAGVRLRATALALEGNVSLLAGLLQRPDDDAADNLCAGLLHVAMRQARGQFGPAEGMLSSEAIASLAADFPAARIYSATELEQYAACPFRYFLERVLHVEPLEELALEIDFLERGRLAHEVMAAFHRRVNRLRGGPASPTALGDEEYNRLLDETLAETIGQSQRRSGAGRVAGGRSPPAGPVVRRLSRATPQVRRLVAGLRLSAVCRRFSRFPSAVRLRGEGPPSTAEPLLLDCGEQTVRIAGRIDRIDLGRAAGEEVFNVVDYKTGDSVRFSVEAVRRGLALQLPLYAMAAAEVVLSDRDIVPWQAGYWHVAGDGFAPRKALKMYRQAGGSLEPEPDWEAMRANISETAAGLVRGIRRGEFPVAAAQRECTGHCPYAAVCRIHQVRSLEKTWQPPRSDRTDRAATAGDRRARRFRRAVGRRRLRQDVRPDGAIPRLARTRRKRRPGAARPVDRHHLHRAGGAGDARPHPQSVHRRGSSTPRKSDVDHWLRLVRQLDAAQISTIHSFCGSLLRAHAVEAGVDPRFQVLDQAQADTLLFELIDQELRQRLAAGEEAVIDLVVRFGLGSLRDMVGQLLTRRQEIDWPKWRAETPDGLVQRWEAFWREVAMPRIASRIADSPEAVEILDVIRRDTASHPLMRQRCDAPARALVVAGREQGDSRDSGGDCRKRPRAGRRDEEGLGERSGLQRFPRRRRKSCGIRSRWSSRCWLSTRPPRCPPRKPPCG